MKLSMSPRTQPFLSTTGTAGCTGGLKDQKSLSLSQLTLSAQHTVIGINIAANNNGDDRNFLNMITYPRTAPGVMQLL
jgi:hypothetical protein